MRPAVVLVAGLSYGDEGKGTTVDYLVRRLGAGTVVRYNGGSQAAHNVVTDDGRHHTFQQFGAGTFAGARTFLSKHVLVNPINLLAEARALAENGVRDPLKLVTIDRRCRIITPYHVAANRLREISRGDARHGSCGQGVGETVSDYVDGGEMIYADHFLDDSKTLRERLAAVRANKRKQLQSIVQEFMSSKHATLGDTIERELQMLMDDHVLDMTVDRFKLTSSLVVDGDDQLSLFMSQPEPIVFEGAQGVLLDEWRGFHPYTTWSTTTFENAEELLAPFEPFDKEVRRVGVLRTYLTRHGAGPLVTEDRNLNVPEAHNNTNAWQGVWRAGHFDLVMLRYALEACGGVDEIALTHLDQTPANLQVCESYANLTETQLVQWQPNALMDRHDLVAQGHLTQQLLHVSPCYGEIRADGLEEAIETVAGAPITIRSRGPRASDKIESEG